MPCDEPCPHRCPGDPPAPERAPQGEPGTATLVRPDRGWKVVLFNDDVTPFEVVIFALMKAAGLSGEVAEAVAHRHWVFSFPKMLRPYFKFNRALLKDLYRIARGDAWWLGCARPSAGRDWHLKESHPYPHRIQ